MTVVPLLSIVLGYLAESGIIEWDLPTLRNAYDISGRVVVLPDPAVLRQVWATTGATASLVSAITRYYNLLDHTNIPLIITPTTYPAHTPHTHPC